MDLLSDHHLRLYIESTTGLCDRLQAHLSNNPDSETIWNGSDDLSLESSSVRSSCTTPTFSEPAQENPVEPVDTGHVTRSSKEPRSLLMRRRAAKNPIKPAERLLRERTIQMTAACFPKDTRLRRRRHGKDDLKTTAKDGTVQCVLEEMFMEGQRLDVAGSLAKYLSSEQMAVMLNKQRKLVPFS